MTSINPESGAVTEIDGWLLDLNNRLCDELEDPQLIAEDAVSCLQAIRDALGIIQRRRPAAACALTPAERAIVLNALGDAAEGREGKAYDYYCADCSEFDALCARHRTDVTTAIAYKDLASKIRSAGGSR